MFEGKLVHIEFEVKAATSVTFAPRTGHPRIRARSSVYESAFLNPLFDSHTELFDVLSSLSARCRARGWRCCVGAHGNGHFNTIHRDGRSHSARHWHFHRGHENARERSCLGKVRVQCADQLLHYVLRTVALLHGLLTAWTGKNDTPPQITQPVCRNPAATLPAASSWRRAANGALALSWQNQLTACFSKRSVLLIQTRDLQSLPCAQHSRPHCRRISKLLKRSKF